MLLRLILKDIFTKPYRLLPHAVFLFAVLCFFIHPNGAMRTGYLADTDDYMRLNQTINWLQGQGWFDLTHPRLSPGAHTVVHWARLLDLPAALLTLPFVKFMGMQNAVLLASFIVPPATFAVLLWLATSLAKSFVGAERANLAAPLALFMPLLMMNFAPGRVDHHGYEVLVAGFGLLCLERMAEDERFGHRYAVYAAIVFACGLWIGTEALPWVIMFTACLAVMAAILGGELLRRAVLFGVAFVLSTALVLPLAVEPAEYSSFALSWYSAADVVFAASVAGMFLGVFVLDKICKRVVQVPPPFLREGIVVVRVDKSSLDPSRKGGREAQGSRAVRMGFMGILGLIAAALFFHFVPNALHGPFADYDDYDSTIALASIGEAQPLAQTLHFNAYNHLQTVSALSGMGQLVLLPVIGLIAVGFAWRCSLAHQRMMILAHGVFLASSIALTLFWQMRIGWFMEFFALSPLTYALVSLWKGISNRTSGRLRFALEIIVFAALGFIPVVMIPAMAHDAPFFSDVVLFPAARPPATCPLRTATDFLNASWSYGDRTHTIISGANEGPELLFRTSHNVIAANFNVAGNEDVYNFFGARDEATAQAIAGKWHADLVLICRSFPLAYARLDHAHIGSTAFLNSSDDGKLRLISNPDHPTLIEMLVRGETPAWLKPVEIPMDKDYLLFEIRG